MRASGISFLLAAGSVLNIIENSKKTDQSEGSNSMFSHIVAGSTSKPGLSMSVVPVVAPSGHRRRVVQTASSPLSNSTVASRQTEGTDQMKEVVSQAPSTPVFNSIMEVVE